MPRVVGKAQWSAEGPNPRFVITNEPTEAWSAQALYEVRYSGRGSMETRIKARKLDRFGGRTSTAFLAASRLRLWFSPPAYRPMSPLRHEDLHGDYAPVLTVPDSDATVSGLLSGAAARVRVRVSARTDGGTSAPREPVEVQVP